MRGNRNSCRRSAHGMLTADRPTPKAGIVRAIHRFRRSVSALSSVFDSGCLHPHICPPRRSRQNWSELCACVLPRFFCFPLSSFSPLPRSRRTATLIGTVVDGTKGGAARRDRHRHADRHRPRVHRRVATSAVSIACAASPPGRYKVQAELSGFSTVVIPDIELLVGQNRIAAVRDAGRVAVGNPDRDRRSAARRRQLHAGGRQRRSPPDGRTAAAGPQLDGAGDAGQGHHRQRRRHHARRARPRRSS